MEFKRYYRSSNLILASCLGESRGKIVLWSAAYRYCTPSIYSMYFVIYNYFFMMQLQSEGAFAVI